MQDDHMGHEAVVIGAGPAGLACAAALKAIGGSVTLLERENEMAPAWRRHYDRLHLHTPKRHSGLPGLPMPREYPDYPSRDQVISYLKIMPCITRSRRDSRIGSQGRSCS